MQKLAGQELPMLEVLIGLIVLPTTLILVWNWVLSKMNTLVWDAYRYTGVIGAPVHELSHALMCLVFGMKIMRVRLYAPNALTGTLGYVRFAYNTYSPFHALGRMFQGVAPMITASLILIYALDLTAGIGRPGDLSLLGWVWQSAVITGQSAAELLFSGWKGALLAMVLAILALHLIPSVSDIQVTLGGLGMILLSFVALLVGLDFIQANGSVFGIDSVFDVDVSYYLGVALDAIESFLWLGVLGVTGTVVMALIGSTAIIVLPALAWYVRDFIRGAKGDV